MSVATLFEVRHYSLSWSSNFDAQTKDGFVMPKPKFCIPRFDGPDPALVVHSIFLFHSLLQQASSLCFSRKLQQLRFSLKIQPAPSMATVRIPSSTTATTLLGKGSTKTFSASHQPTQAQEQPILSSKPFHHFFFFFPRPITCIAAAHLPPLMNHPLEVERIQPPKAFSRDGAFQNHQLRSALLGGAAGLGIALLLTSGGGGGAASAAELPSLLVSSSSSSLQLNEPGNALSLPTWAIHVSSVVEWIAAMILVWQYGEKSGYESWKGLSWGMVPLLGGAFCACTWHFFYNSESLNILVALQAALTVIGNFTICIAAYRICKSSQEVSKDL